MSEEKKEYLNYAFRWGSIIGFVTLIWYLIGFFTGFDKKIVFGDIYFFIEVVLLGWALIKYRKINAQNSIKFSRLMIISLLSALVIAAFYTLYFILRMTKLDPLFFQNYIYEASLAMKSVMGVDYTQVIATQPNIILKISFIIALYFSSVVNTIIYALIICAFLYLNDRMLQRK